MKMILVAACLAMVSGNAFSSSVEDCLRKIEEMTNAKINGNNLITKKTGQRGCGFYLEMSNDYKNFMSFSNSIVIGLSDKNDIRKHSNQSCTITENKMVLSYTYKEVFEDRKTHSQSLVIEKLGKGLLKASVSDKKGIFNEALKASCVFSAE